jgi:hypothetical protein
MEKKRNIKEWREIEAYTDGSLDKDIMATPRWDSA